MPLGNIIRIVRKPQPLVSIVCWNSLYDEELETRYFKSEGCKSMLLQPRNASRDVCRKLKLNIDNTKETKYYILKLDIDDTKETKYYICRSYHYARIYRRDHGNDLLSTIKNVKCSCGELMNHEVTLADSNTCTGDYGASGVFVMETATFLITDNLQVVPMSTTSSFSLPKNQRIGDLSTRTLEEKTLDVGPEEISISAHINIFGLLAHFTSLQNPFDGRVFDEAKGAKWFLLNLFGPTSSFGCTANFHNSVEGLAVGMHMKSEDLKAMLLSPKLGPQLVLVINILSLRKHPS
ncbi:hypothetical protein GIB67_007613 [Kingdonia uniflora]|uniref:Uncharacterized protein n=1 Tax=Kingdonia uniflora TaxID=39325 RepID=A0A7J7N1T0_9MAGN|nr:hypothetical protein GIB67_007613 [Kingdonia uniflora]